MSAKAKTHRKPPNAQLDASYESYKVSPSPTTEAVFVTAIGNLARIKARKSGIVEYEDLVQDITISIWNSKSTYNPTKSKFSTWASSAIRKHIGGYLEHKGSLPSFTPLDSLSQSEFDKLLVDAASPIESQERRAAIEKYVIRLPLLQRQVVQSRLEGYSFEEISNTLGIGLSSAKMHWQGALRELLK